MNRNGSGVVVILGIVAAALIGGAIWYYESYIDMRQTWWHPTSNDVGAGTTKSPSSTATVPCDIAKVDFGSQSLQTDRFGEINLNNGTDIQKDDAGNPDWTFTLLPSSSLYKFGTDTIRIVDINVNHLSGSGEFILALGYACQGDDIQKMFEQSSFAPPVIAQKGNILSITTWQAYEGAAFPQGKITTQFEWSDGIFWKKYYNKKYGFTIKYPANQPDPGVATNATSPIYSSMVGETGFGLVFDDNTIQFKNPIYDPQIDGDGEVVYSTSSREWITGGKLDDVVPCPEEATTTNQGVPFYVIQTGHHAGDNFDAYVVAQGIIAVAQGIYSANDSVIRDEVTFDNPKSVFKVGCRMGSI